MSERFHRDGARMKLRIGGFLLGLGIGCILLGTFLFSPDVVAELFYGALGIAWMGVGSALVGSAVGSGWL